MAETIQVGDERRARLWMGGSYRWARVMMIDDGMAFVTYPEYPHIRAEWIRLDQLEGS